MANSKAKDLVPVIDSHGGFSQRRRAWVAKHEAKGSGRWERGTFRFFTEEELSAQRAVSRPVEREPEARSASLFGWHGHSVQVAGPQFDEGRAPYLPYPQADRGQRATGLRGRYPGLAGAGLR